MPFIIGTVVDGRLIWLVQPLYWGRDVAGLIMASVL
jgi:hypothetical protein